MREVWVVFKLNGEEICSYTMDGTFAGELVSTKELLASEKGCDVKDIEVTVVLR